MIVLLDNQDSFVYNLVDALAGFDTVVYRNTVAADTVLGGGLGADPELIVLSPGPGYPADAGCMMEVIERAQGRIPILGICLGYQALIEHFGGHVQPCGPEHGASVPMRLSAPHPLFRGLTVGGAPGQPGLDVPVARYHSLGATEAPAGITPLAWTDTAIGEVIMAAETDDGYSIGFQFHPESILTPQGLSFWSDAWNTCCRKDATMADHVEIFRRFIDNPAPTLEDAVEAFTPLTVGDYDDVHIAALLATIRTRGETFADIAGAAKAFLAAGRPFPVTGKGIMDTAGTGGDGANTINITTAASLIAAAGGVKMIKCGNRSVSSKSGSADVLEALNIPLDLDPERAVRQFESSNFTFLFAPAYNPAIAFVQPVRKKLGVSTLFNTMGPLLSPARPEFQIMGIANHKLGPTIAETMKTLGRSRALVVHGAGTDEIAVHGETLVWELKDGAISHYTVEPAELGVDRHTLEDLRGGDGEHNAAAMRATFAGEGPAAHRDAVAVNAGAMFYLYGIADSLAEGTAHAKQLLADGSVSQWLTTHEEADYSG